MNLPPYIIASSMNFSWCTMMSLPGVLITLVSHAQLYSSWWASCNTPGLIGDYRLGVTHLALQLMMDLPLHTFPFKSWWKWHYTPFLSAQDGPAVTHLSSQPVMDLSLHTFPLSLWRTCCYTPFLSARNGSVVTHLSFQLMMDIMLHTWPFTPNLQLITGRDLSPARGDAVQRVVQKSVIIPVYKELAPLLVQRTHERQMSG